MDKQRSAQKATRASQKVIRLLVSPKKIFGGKGHTQQSKNAVGLLREK
jgi:hypothetical protein